MKKLKEGVKQELVKRAFDLQRDIAAAIRLIQDSKDYSKRKKYGLSRQAANEQVENIYQNFYKCLHSLNIATAVIERAGLTKAYRFAIQQINDMMKIEEDKLIEKRKKESYEQKKAGGNGKIIPMPRGFGGQGEKG